MTQKMSFASATITDVAYPGDVLESITSQINQQINVDNIDLLMLFYSPHYYKSIHWISEQLMDIFHPKMLMGSSAEGVIGRSGEYELTKALTVFAASFEDVNLFPFQLQMDINHDDKDALVGEIKNLGIPQDARLLVMIADPFSTLMDDLLEGFNAALRGIPIVGGLASGSLRPGGNIFLFNKNEIYQGVVGFALSGDFIADVVVTGSCRPIGESVTVTGVENNMITSVENMSPLSWLQTTMARLNTYESSLAREGIFIGRAINAQAENMDDRDFLIHGVLGVEENYGVLKVSGQIHPGDTIQLHVRDAKAALEDLALSLSSQNFRGVAAGALLFASNGRGTRLYDHQNGDVEVIQKHLGNIPLAGMFCAGEIGPIRKKNFLQSHTVSMVVFKSSK